MDWRNRAYYIVQSSYGAGQIRDSILNSVSKSIEFHAPYNHFTEQWYDNKWAPNKYDGYVHKVTGIFAPSFMMSCNKADSKVIEDELNKAIENGINIKYFKLTKEVTGQ